MPLRQTPKGLFLHIGATPKAGCNKATGLIANAAGQFSLAVKVTSPAENGAANKSIMETLAKAMGVSKSSFRLASGETSRNKVLEVLKNEDAIRHFIAEFQK